MNPEPPEPTDPGKCDRCGKSIEHDEELAVCRDCEEILSHR